jgi:hypothetical protein
LPSLVSDGLISQDQKYKILERLVATKTSISLPKPFELEMNSCIDQCVNDKLNNTNSFDKPVEPPKVNISEEDVSERFIREMLENENKQQKEIERRNE